MSFNLASISRGASLRAPRIILLGVEKIGKSTFAAGSNNPIFIPIRQEEGIDGLDVPKFPTARSLDDVLSAIGSLYEEDHEYQTVVIDSASALQPVIYDAVCGEAKVSNIEEIGYGKGYSFADDKWRQIMDGLDALREHKNMACIIIGHVKVKRFDDPERDSYDQYQFDLRESAANSLFRWADFIGFANNKVAVKEDKEGFSTKKRAIDTANGGRFLFTKKTPAHPGGGRVPYGNLPNEIPLNWAAFQDAVAAAAAVK